MPLRLFTAPQLSPLLDHLAESIARDPLPPRDEEVIVVQSQGMRRWVTLQLADRFGCAGSVVLPFPARFVRELEGRLARESAGRDERDPFSRDALTWRIEALLRALPVGDDAYVPLRRYLVGADERARFGLAAQVAARFDDYQMFRADVLHEWEAGRDAPADLPHARWQAAIWRTLCTEAGDGALHLAARMRRMLDALRETSPANLPPRVSVFGVSTLPPAFVDLLVALARDVPVTVYSASLDPEAPHQVARTFGKQSSEFLRALTTHGATSAHLASSATSGGGLLQALQRELAGNESGESPIALDAEDPSLRIHDAHGQLRQVEIIRDQLLAALSADPSLRPHDLLLLVPDAAEWAPLVDAVFGVKADGTPLIPYRIADRPLRRTEPAAEALTRLLGLEGGRFQRSEILGFLSHPLARQAAQLTEGEIETLEVLIDRVNVRWGYDDKARQALDLPSYEDASWRAGLDRLLLGAAVGRVDELVLDLLPEAGDTAGDPEVLATFADWVDALNAEILEWRKDRTLREWSARLLAAVERFLHGEEVAEQQMLLSIAETIRRLASLQEVAGYESRVPFAVVRDWLEGELDEDGFGSGFLQGGMTVAALKPMRSLPFRVIAVAGLDDGVFPRRERRSAFDLLEHDRRPGDRDLRTDDRQLFLDLLLAAQDRLILAYGGRAVSDNSPRAPSVLLDELLDHLDRRTGGEARRLLVVQHPLQPFSAQYFAPLRDPRLVSYSRAHANAARASARQGDGDLPFLTSPVNVAPPPSGRFELTLDDLVDCWENPSRYFCKKVLNFTLPDDGAGAPDDELFEPSVMEQGGVRALMLRNALGGERDAMREQQRLIANGKLPPQALGNAWHAKLWQEVDEVLQAIPSNHTKGAPIPFTVDGEGWRLSGRIDGLRGGERYVVRAGSVRAGHRIRAWVEHIAMCAAHQNGVTGLPTTTVLVGKNERKKVVSQRFAVVHDASALLNGLVAAFREGLSSPLPFFPQAAWTWCEVLYPPRPTRGKPAPPGTSAEAREAATEVYHAEPDEHDSGGDVNDPYIALCFRGTDPMQSRWADFERLVTLLFTVSPGREGDA